MKDDPLERHHGLIAVAERGQQEGHDHVVGLQCIADLAAALRAERERVAELGRELAFADSDVAAKRNYIEELEGEMAVAKRLDSDQFEQIEGLRGRVAELEPLADLGRLAADPPKGSWIQLLADDYPTDETLAFVASWEKALEAARKGET